MSCDGFGAAFCFNDDKALLERREGNRQKQPHQISKFDKGQPKR